MTWIKPFKAFRPASKFVEKVASRPYDVMSRDEARRSVEGNLYSFLRVIRSELELNDNVSAYDPIVYDNAKANFDLFCKEQIFAQDTTDSYYFYQLEMGPVKQTGIVALSSVEDYWNDVIKKHEYTRPKKEKDRIDHITNTGLQTGPVFLAYKQHTGLDQLIKNFLEQNDPIYDFDLGDEVKHRFWCLKDPTLVAEISRIFKEDIPATYIADGHHRAASSSKVSKKLAEEGGGIDAEHPANFFLSVLFSDHEVNVIDYNRVVSDLNGHTNESLLAEIAKNFEVQEATAAVKPTKPGEFGMYLANQWYRLLCKDPIVAEDPVEQLDIYVLSDRLIEPFLGIRDQRTDERIDFVGGIRGLKELEKRVNSGDMKVAFSIFPVSMDQLFAVADSGNVMPPKSTWFEPKLRSGLVVHKIYE